MNCRSRRISSFPGTSLRTNSCVSRTAPSGRLIVSCIFLCSDSVISQLPPPTSTSTQRPPAPGSFSTMPRWISRPSSSPEMISTSQPVSSRTHAWKARELRASRIADVATARTLSVPCDCTAL